MHSKKTLKALCVGEKCATSKPFFHIVKRLNPLSLNPKHLDKILNNVLMNKLSKFTHYVTPMKQRLNFCALKYLNIPHSLHDLKNMNNIATFQVQKVHGAFIDAQKVLELSKLQSTSSKVPKVTKSTHKEVY